MNSTSFMLLLNILALSIACMDLSLAIVYSQYSNYKWTKYFIVFVATCLGAITLEMLYTWSHLTFTGIPSFILQTVWRSLLIMDGAFLLSFIPYFTTWIIAHPWRNPYKSIFFIFSLLYCAIGVLTLIYQDNEYLEISEYSIVTIVLVFCIIVIFKNLKSIDNKEVRFVLKSNLIAAVIVLPFSLFGIFFKVVRTNLLPLIVIIFGSMILDFLFISISRHNKEKSKSSERSLDDFYKKYKITEREAGVINLIKRGMTTKEISNELNISVNTVNNHIANIFSKTEVRSRIDLLNLIQEIWV